MPKKIKVVQPNPIKVLHANTGKTTSKKTTSEEILCRTEEIVKTTKLPEETVYTIRICEQTTSGERTFHNTVRTKKPSRQQIYKENFSKTCTQKISNKQNDLVKEENLKNNYSSAVTKAAEQAKQDKALQKCKQTFMQRLKYIKYSPLNPNLTKSANLLKDVLDKPVVSIDFKKLYERLENKHSPAVKKAAELKEDKAGTYASISSQSTMCKTATPFYNNADKERQNNSPSVTKNLGEELNVAL